MSTPGYSIRAAIGDRALEVAARVLVGLDDDIRTLFNQARSLRAGLAGTMTEDDPTVLAARRMTRAELDVLYEETHGLDKHLPENWLNCQLEGGDWLFMGGEEAVDLGLNYHDLPFLGLTDCGWWNWEEVDGDDNQGQKVRYLMTRIEEGQPHIGQLLDLLRDAKKIHAWRVERHSNFVADIREYDEQKKQAREKVLRELYAELGLPTDSLQ